MIKENNKEPALELVFKNAMKSRVYDAEKNLVHLRSVIIFFNIACYLVLDDISRTPLLAYTVIALASIYTLYLEIFRPYEKYEIFTTAYFTAISDGILICLWIYVTGGYASPFYIIWYISIIAVAFRFNSTVTMITAMFYAICYSLVIVMSGTVELLTHATEILIRIVYIILTGFAGVLITRENIIQTIHKVKLELLSKEVELVNNQLSDQTILYENMLQAQSEMGEGVAILSDDKLSYVNDALCLLTGYSREELMDMDAVINLIAAEERAKMQEASQRRWDGDISESYDETWLIRKNGEKMAVGFSSIVFEINLKKNMFFIMKDITEQKRKDEELRTKTKDLELQNAELQQFAYFASHDLLEPLRMVNSFLTLLEKKYNDQLDETAHQYINFATDGAIRMRKTILDLLDYSRVGTQAWEEEMVDMNALMNEIMIVLSSSISETNAKISWGKLPQIKGGRTHLQLVLQNLISNSLKYKSPDLAPIIEISSSETETHWQFSVSDNGIGIDPKFFDRIFILFQRLHSKEEYAGSGVGLAIAKKIVENHGGKIWVESGKDIGSVFYFNIHK